MAMNFLGLGVDYPKPRNERRLENILPGLGYAMLRGTLDPIALAARGDVPQGAGGWADYLSSMVPGAGAFKGAAIGLGGLGALGHTVYHGSPHRFDRFDISKIGTGEGAQVYGHGLYFAESPEVAETYAGMSKKHKVQPDSAHIHAARDFLKHNLDPAEGLKSAYPGITTDQIESAVIEARGGFSPNLYKADIPDEWLPQMLDWDTPISEQPDAILDAIDANPMLTETFRTVKKNQLKHLSPDERESVTGETLYRALSHTAGGRDQAAAVLQQAGIPGIKYFDQMSRGTGEGTRNFVVFTDEGIKILERK